MRDRDHAAAYDGTLNAKLRWTPGDDICVTLLANAFDGPVGGGSSEITQQAHGELRQAATPTAALDAGEATQQGSGRRRDRAPHRAACAVDIRVHMLYRDS